MERKNNTQEGEKKERERKENVHRSGKKRMDA